MGIERENFFLKTEHDKVLNYVSIHLRMLLIRTSESGKVELTVQHCDAVRQRIEGLISTIAAHKKFTIRQKQYLIEIIKFEAAFFSGLCSKALDKI